MPTESYAKPASVEDARAFADTLYDYVIVGGGNAGLPLATRLSENPDVKVAVIEAGILHSNDPLVEMPGQVGMAVGKPEYDWAFQTTPQARVGDRVMPVARGKMLGGSSGINYLAWDRASKDEYDGWKTLSSNAGDPECQNWDWNGILPFLRKAESFLSEAENPNEFLKFSSSNDISNSGLAKEQSLGRDGNIKTGVNVIYPGNNAPFVRGMNELGFKTNSNPFGGEGLGVYNTYRSVDLEKGIRSYAANGYFPSAKERPNFTVLTGGQATRIVFDEKPSGTADLVARGVDFVVDGQTFTVRAAKEVILCAGVVQTPQLLELSGIGNAKLLKPLGIEPLIDLPNVGENLQDHLFVPSQVIAKPDVETFDKLAEPEFMAEQKKIYAETKTGWLSASDSATSFLALRDVVADDQKYTSMITRLEQSIEKADAEGKLTLLVKHVYALQLEWIKAGKSGQIETFMFARSLVPLPESTEEPVPAKKKHCFVLLSGIQHAFSRGSIHIDSADPLKPPIIDPNYLSSEFDVESMSIAYRFLEKLIETKALQSVIDTVVVPPTKRSTEEMIRGYISETLMSGSHPMGTAAMARRELGGVVSSSLKVYGTANLRIVDSSIIPVTIAAHLQATVYAIAEKAADIIQKGY